jgi:hypothetical protein
MPNTAVIKLVAGLLGTIVMFGLCLQPWATVPLVLRLLAVIAGLLLWAIHVRDWQNSGALLASTASKAIPDPISVPSANISIWSGPTMKRVGVLVAIDVPDETTPEEIAKLMPQVIDSGFEIFDEPGRTSTAAWERRRMVVLSDQHREAFERCLTPEGSS